MARNFLFNDDIVPPYVTDIYLSMYLSTGFVVAA